jgi:hypothetical protein
MALIAKFGGICPFCSTFIAKGRSRIVRLHPPVAPRATPDGRFSLDTGQAYYATGASITLEPRKYAHERCAPLASTAPRFRSRQEGDRYWPVPRAGGG